MHSGFNAKTQRGQPQPKSPWPCIRAEAQRAQRKNRKEGPPRSPSPRPLRLCAHLFLLARSWFGAVHSASCSQRGFGCGWPRRTTIVQNRFFGEESFTTKGTKTTKKIHPDGLVQYFVSFVSFVVKLGCGLPRWALLLFCGHFIVGGGRPSPE